MKEVRTQDGKILHMPDEQQRPQTVESGFFHCACHERMGNDFYFLPMNSCLRPDRVCTNTKGQRLDA
jgi:hypothetical protein